MRDIWRMNMCERANGEQSYARSLWGAQLQFDSIINSQTNATCYVICHIFYPTSHKTTSFTQVYTSSYENETNKLQTIHLWIYLSVLNLARDIYMWSDDEMCGSVYAKLVVFVELMCVFWMFELLSMRNISFEFLLPKIRNFIRECILIKWLIPIQTQIHNRTQLTTPNDEHKIEPIKLW